MTGVVASRPQGLTSTDKAAALLDAHGHSRASIAKALDVSGSTIARLRRHPDYQAEVAKFKELGVDSIRPLVNRVNGEIMEGVSKAVAALEEMLTAEDADGNPLYSVREGAAKLLIDAGIKITGPTVAVQAQESGPARTPSATISFNINSDGTVKVDAEGSAEDDGED